MSTNPRTAVTASSACQQPEKEAWIRVTLGPQSAVLLLITTPRAGIQKISAAKVTSLWNSASTITNMGWGGELKGDLHRAAVSVAAWEAQARPVLLMN